jgi:hypothetical protein
MSERISNDSLELFYLQIGSTPLLENVYLGLNIPLAVVAFFLNMLSYLVFSVPNQGLMQTKRELNVYLRIYCLFSMLQSLLGISNSIVSAPRYLNFVLTFTGSFFRSHFIPSTLKILFLFKFQTTFNFGLFLLNILK